MSVKKKIPNGYRSGRLVVIGESNKRSTDRQVIYNCKCDCGNYVMVIGYSLRKKITKSCGCIWRETVPGNNKTHNQSKPGNWTPEYRTWVDIKTRCNNSNYHSYKNYGGRGIKVCERWNNSFENFYKDMGKKPYNYVIDRINNDGNYEPNNCKYTTKKISANNKRNNRIIKIKLPNGNSEIGSIPEISSKYNLRRSGIHSVLSGRYKQSQGYTFEYLI